METTLTQQSPQIDQGKPDGAAHPAGHDADETAVPKDLKKAGWLTIIALALLFIVLMAVLFYVGLVPHQAADKQIKADAAELETDVPVVIAVAPSVLANAKELILPCDVCADQETAIYPRTSGYLKERKVDIQDRVKKDDLLAVIDSPEVDAQLNEAKGSLEQAKGALAAALATVTKTRSDLDLATSTLNRYKVLREGETVTQQELEDKENAQTQAEGALAQAEGALAQAKADVVAATAAVARYTVLQGFENVYAPFDGVITARNYDVGALLSPSNTAPGKEMFRITKLNPLRVFVSVPQTNVGEVKIDSTAMLDIRGRQSVQGKVARKANAVDINTRTMLFELHFENDGTLYPGMYGMARLQLSQERQRLTIPVAALRFDARGTQVAVIKGGDTVQMQKVTLGRDFGNALEVVDGLAADDLIVTNLSERITDGTKVKLSKKE